VKAVVVLFVALVSQTVLAAPSEQFSEGKFNEAALSGQPFVVAFHSNSCGSCKVQKPNLEAALLDGSLKNVRGFMANFESTASFRKGLEQSVRGPSTILVFNHGKEVARILGETNRDKILTAIQTSLKN
jgi:hypothetical protein